MSWREVCVSLDALLRCFPFAVWEVCVWRFESRYFVTVLGGMGGGYGALNGL